MAKKTKPTTTTNYKNGKARLLRLIDNLRKNAENGQIEAIVVGVAMFPAGIYPNDGLPNEKAGGYTAAIDLARCGDGDDDMVQVERTVVTRGITAQIGERISGRG
jgi:hypothetical protein